MNARLQKAIGKLKAIGGWLKRAALWLWRLITRLWATPRRAMAWAVLIGILLVLIFLGLVRANCPAGPIQVCISPAKYWLWPDAIVWLLCHFCLLMDKHAPWILFTGIAVAPSVLLVWYWRERHKRDDIKNAEEGLVNAEERLVTERFTRAIDQLGSEKMEVRLGAIYALERISRDSEKDHWTIVEILAAFIRENAPWHEEEKPTDAGEEKPAEDSNQTEQEGEEKKPKIFKPRTDVQAALTVLGRRAHREKEPANLRIDLTHVDLRGADLKEAHLERAKLLEAHLENANLGLAHLEGANLRKAHLERANLGEAHLERADLNEAHLEGAVLLRAHLERVKLTEAHLEGAFLLLAHLEGANLTKAHLEGVVFLEAHLEGAMLHIAHLEKARLSDAHMERAFLMGAHLEGANLSEAHLEGAFFLEAHLEGANLKGAHLDGTDLREVDLRDASNLEGAILGDAKYSKYTRFPDGFEPEKHGMTYDGQFDDERGKI
ncbi:MAG: low-complexity protein [Myxococcales bacterium]|nr:MAG: low-complexity protein [Myxococcales bacterium]